MVSRIINRFQLLFETTGYISTHYSPVCHWYNKLYPYDLHVLSMSTAFVLSQDQTLMFVVQILHYCHKIPLYNLNSLAPIYDTNLFNLMIKNHPNQHVIQTCSNHKTTRTHISNRFVWTCLIWLSSLNIKNSIINRVNQSFKTSNDEKAHLYRYAAYSLPFRCFRSIHFFQIPEYQHTHLITHNHHHMQLQQCTIATSRNNMQLRETLSTKAFFPRRQPPRPFSPSATIPYIFHSTRILKHMSRGIIRIF